MNDLQIFNYEDRAVRTVTIGGEPWWVAKDVCDILGYSNHSDALTRHCKGVVKRYPLQTPGGVQDTRIINEPDLYRLIVGSNLPEAEKFEAWVFEKVLPSIRKTGQYNVEQNPQKLISMALIEAHKILEEQKPLVEFAEAVRESKDGKLIREFAKSLNPTTGEKRLFVWLRGQNILMPNSREPYQSFIDRGYFDMKPNTWQDSSGEEHISYTPLITGKGQLYIERKWREQHGN